MKILKRFLIVGLFSVIFCMGNAKALQSYTTTTIPVIQNYLSNHSGKTIEDFIDEQIIPYFEFPSGYDETDDHILVISKPGSNINISIRLDYMPTEYHLAMINNGVWLRAENEYKKYTKYIYFYNNGENYGTSTSWTLESASAENTNNLPNNSSGYGMPIISTTNNYNYIVSTSYNNFEYRLKSTQSESFKVNNGTTYNFNDNVDIGFLSSGGVYNFSVYNRFNPVPPEPTYSMTQTILENGNVKLDFTFTNYSDNYGFTITNKVSDEEYGIENPYVNIYPNIIPYGDTYSIEIPYDTIIDVSLSLYTQIEESSLYDREVIYVDSYDINNIVFSDPQQPYFSIISQTQDNLIGRYHNTKNNDICGHIYSNNNVEWETDCNSVVDIDFSLNGYVEMYVKRNNNIIYSRKINYIAQNDNQPYIEWTIDKQDFYSVVNWTIKNYDNQMIYRYSKDNGQTYTTWSNATENNYINVYDNNTIIIEIANNDQSIIYDTKAINVVNNITNLGNKNNTTINFIDKFASIFSTNENILNKINEYWALIKNSKLYLLIFIPFITSIICGIIYMIRRK